MFTQYLVETPVASLIFALTLVTSFYAFSNAEIYSKFMLNPYSIARNKRKYYTIFTSGLIHKDMMHLLFNMITFYYFAFTLEKIMVAQSGFMGHVFFAGLYIISLVLSDIPTILQNKDNPHYFSLGASGAISAVLFSFILFYPKMTLGIFMIIPMPAYLFAFLFLGYCVWAARQGQGGINHHAHLFGALTGLLLTILIYPWILSHFIAQF